MCALVAILATAVVAGCGGKREAEAAAEEPTGRPDVAVPAPPAGPGIAGDEAGVLPGEKLVNARCTVCHTLDRVTKRKETREGWEKIVDQMIKNGAILDEGERDFVVDYLTGTYGK
jgi:cytochrome c5